MKNPFDRAARELQRARARAVARLQGRTQESRGSRLREGWNRRWDDDAYKPRFEIEGADPSVRRAVEDGWFTADMRAVDIGCGAGHNAAWLAQSGLETVGIDYARSAVNRARTTHEGVDGLTFEVVDVAKIGQSDWTFDALVDRGCLHGLSPDDRPTYLRNLQTWARPGSHFLLLMRTKDISEAEVVTKAREYLRTGFTFVESRAVDLAGPYADEPVPAVAMRFVRNS